MNKLRSQNYLNSDFIEKLCSIGNAGFLLSISSVLPIVFNFTAFIFNSKNAQAQSVISAGDGAGTIVNSNGNRFDITGGQFSQDGRNLFHSFRELGLNQNQIANFIGNPGIENIFGRVIGGNASVINGLIQVSGSNSNLFLINPSGIVFGNNASLNVPSDFTVTTASGIEFGNNWLNAFGKNDYGILTGKPISFAFAMNQPGAIINAGNLKVNNGNLSLLGGTVASTGNLEAASGNIIVSAIPGKNLLKLSQPGNLLSLEIKPISAAKNLPQPGISIASLPEMLTGGNSGVTKLIRNSNGEVELKGSGLTLNQGDATVKTLNAKNALLSADRNLTFFESQLQTTENLTLLAKDTVRVRDSQTNPFIAVAGGDFYLRGDRHVDILALNHLDKTPFVSGGDLSLVSNGIISGDAHFASGGKFAILNLQGDSGKFISLYDPIISSEEDVTFGDYTGAALKVESKGSITVNGDIQITSSDTNLCQSTCSNDAQILANEEALILRAGVSSLEEPTFNYPSGFNNAPATVGFENTSFNTDSTITSPANVTVNGDILTGSDSTKGRVGRVIISAPGNISTNNISTYYLEETPDTDDVFSGDINLKAGGNISTKRINSSISRNNKNFFGGNINFEAGGKIVVEDGITTSAKSSNYSTQISSGDISLKAGGKIVVEDGINASVSVASADDISTGKIDIDSGGDIFVSEIKSSVDVNGSSFPISPSNNVVGKEIKLKAAGDIIAGKISSKVDLFATSDNALPGSINLTANGNIYVEDVEAFVELDDVSAKNVAAGDVNISSGKDIIFGSVNSSSFDEEDFPVGKGGDVRVIAENGTVRGGLYASAEDTIEENFVRELELPEWFKLPEEIKQDFEGELRLIEFNFPNTIFTAGEDSSGSVEIRHDGTNTNVPFIVGDATVNGTAGAINAGDSIISPTTEFSNPGKETQGNIRISFNNNPPDIKVNATVNIAEGNQSVTFDLADIGTQVSDKNNDITKLTINDIASEGTLKINGNEAQAGDIITYADSLEYIPNADAKDKINAFKIVASDKISVSKPTKVSVDIPKKKPDTQPDTTPQTTVDTQPDTDTQPQIINTQPQIKPDTPPQTIPDTKLEQLETKNYPQIPKPPESKPPLLSTSDITFNINNRIEIDTTMGAVEDSFTNAFKSYLGVQIDPTIKGLVAANNILNSVEKATGIKPALVYAMFVPASFDSTLTNKETKLKKDSDVLEILIVTAKGKPIRKQVPGATRAKVLKVARKFQREVANPRKTSTKTYLESSKQLYQWLIAPIEAELQTQAIQNLSFIVDVGLRSIPLAALNDGNSFLVEKYSMGLMPSLSLVNTNYVDIKQAQVLAMGASEFTEQNPLPAVPLEINSISKQWKGRAFLNNSFTLENLKSQRSNQPFGIIHLATHAEFRPGKLKNSYIQLSNEKLQLDEIRNLGWNNPPVELLTLSACRTALGDKEAELGFAGLAVQAGVKSALGSLWYVSDEGTLGLMTQFYQQLKQAPIKAEALRQTQIAMIKGQMSLEKGILQLPQSKNNIPIPSLAGKSRKLTHPYYWASFTLIGSPW
ncbi:MAG: CHAT domain-containing protein [Rivularia sp. (in: Bacteria)]|nr:CHAT domain-containing protein [Rivularia sp. MS3]